MPESVAEALPRSLYSNVFWVLSGNVVYAASQWAILIALAKLGTAEQLGELALALAVTGPLFVASQLHLRGVQATDARREFAFSDYLGLRCIGTVAAVLIAAGLAAGLQYPFETAVIVIVIALARAFDNVSDIYFGALQQHERMARMGKSMMLKGTLTVAGAAAAMALTHSVIVAAVALAVVSSLTFVLYDRNSLTFGGNHAQAVTVEPLSWSPARYWALFKLSVPLTIVLVLVSLNLNMPRYFIEKYQGRADLGIFAALSYLIVAGNTVINACGQAAAPRLANFYANGPSRRFWWLLFTLLTVAAVCGLSCMAVAAAAGERILAILYKPAYAQYAGVLQGLMGAAALLYAGQFLGYGMTAARIFRAQVPLFVLITATTAAACWVWIPRKGLTGAAAAMALGFTVQLVGSGSILFHRWLALKR